MSLKIDRVQLEIVINNDQARKSLRLLDDEARLLTKEMKKLKEGTEEYAQKSARLKAIKVQQDAIYESIGITNMTMKELSRRQNELNTILLHMRPGTEEYKKLKGEVDAVKSRMAELRGNAQQTGVSLRGMADGFNRYFGMATAFMASIAGVVIGFKKLREDIAHLDDVYSDVMKTTGMTREAVLELNQEFKQMDTRTSREELNKLASEAGKLNLSLKEDVIGFTEAGNQIRVALGEDLGEDAIVSIGKMVGVYKDASSELQGLDLKGQMLSVGSAINDIGAKSSASEPYLVAFAGRIGGIARQARISMSDIFGYASALDQDMQAVDMSATALQNFIMKLMADPAKFAKLAGLEVKAFTRLLATDTNAAIKQVLTSMNEKGGFQDLIPMFEEMGLEGARSVGVLSSLAGSIDKVNVAQKQANEAMLAGTSITNEYNIKNNNQAAQLEKARKAFQEQALVLGEKLAPAFAFSTNSLTYLIKALVAAPQFIRENQVLIIGMVGALIAWRAAQLKSIATTVMQHVTLQAGIGLRIKDAVLLQAAIVKEELHAAMIGKTTIAQKAAAAASVTLRNAMAMIGGPISLVVLGITGLISAIKLYDKYNGESVRIEALKAERLRAVAEANDKLKVAYGNQQTEIDKLNTLSRDQIKLLAEQTEATIKQAEADLLVAKTRQVLSREDNTRVSLWEKTLNYLKSGGNATAYALYNATSAAENGMDAASEFDEGIINLTDSIAKLRTQSAGLKDVINAEANADRIATKTKAQLEEKARLYALALRGLVIGSEDYNRVNDKLVATNKALNVTNDSVVTSTGKVTNAYQQLTEQLSVLEEQLRLQVQSGAPMTVIEATLDAINKLKAEKDTIDSLTKFYMAGGAFFDENYFKNRDKQTEKDWEEIVGESVPGEISPAMNQAKLEADYKLRLARETADGQRRILARQLKDNLISQSEFNDEIKKINEAEKNNKLQIWSQALGQMESLFGEQTLAYRLIASTRAGIDTYMAATAALAPPPEGAGPILGPLLAARTIAMGLANIAKINGFKVGQRARGKYDVIGEDDGRRYQADWTGRAETRIYSRPSLVAEQGAELIVDANTTRNLQMNYPGIIEAIYAARVPQRADGNLPPIDPELLRNPELLNAVKRLNDNLEQGIKGKWYLHDLNEAQDKLSNIKLNATF